MTKAISIFLPLTHFSLRCLCLDAVMNSDMAILYYTAVAQTWKNHFFSGLSQNGCLYGIIFVVVSRGSILLPIPITQKPV